MQKARFTPLATQLALTRLSRLHFVEAGEDSDYNQNTFVVYQMLEDDENWLLENQDKLELRETPKPTYASTAIKDDDIPF